MMREASRESIPKAACRTQRCPEPRPTALGTVTMGHKSESTKLPLIRRARESLLRIFLSQDFYFPGSGSVWLDSLPLTPDVLVSFSAFKQGGASAARRVFLFHFGCSTQSNFAEEKMYLTHTARYIIEGSQGRTSRETLEPNP